MTAWRAMHAAARQALEVVLLLAFIWVVGAIFSVLEAVL